MAMFFRAEPCPDVHEEPVEGGVAERMVDLGSDGVSGDVQRDGRQPFPVAIMSQKERDVAASPQRAARLLQALHPDPPAYLALAHGYHFHGLHYVVA